MDDESTWNWLRNSKLKKETEVSCCKRPDTEKLTTNSGKPILTRHHVTVKTTLLLQAEINRQKEVNKAK